VSPRRRQVALYLYCRARNLTGPARNPRAFCRSRRICSSETSTRQGFDSMSSSWSLLVPPFEIL
jgi:hypothetical protein